MKPCFGNHVLIMMCINEQRPKVDPVKRSDWRSYSKDSLCNSINNVIWSYEIDDVQGFWNHFVIVLVSLIDKIVPLKDFVNNMIKTPAPKHINNKINNRNSRPAVAERSKALVS